jgi:hypothetical protein
MQEEAGGVAGAVKKLILVPNGGTATALTVAVNKTV